MNAIVLVASTSTASARDAAWAAAIAIDGVPNLFQVAPNLYRSAQPTALGFNAIENKLHLKSALNLRESQTDQALLKHTKITSFEVPMNAMNITDDEIIAALKYINAHQAGGPLLVHCLHGSDRTGVVMAMYRIINQGWSKQQAIDELENGSFGFHSIFFNIPAYVKNADISQLKAAIAKQ